MTVDYAHKKNELDKRFRIILNEISTSYPLAKVYPGIKEYSNSYKTDSENYNTVKGDIFLLKDSVQNSLSEQDNLIQLLNKQINKQNRIINELTKKETGLMNERNGAIGMYNDTKTEYNTQIIENVLYTVGIGITIFSLFVSN